MGWCHEFGPQIFPTCDHPMVAGPDACSCPECKTVCKGRFAGCAAVWARGPRSISVRVRPSEEPVRRARPASLTIDAGLAADAVPALGSADPLEAVEAVQPSPASPARLVVDRDLHERTVEVVDQLAGKIRRLETTIDAVAASAAASAPSAALDERMPAMVDQLAEKVRQLESSMANAATAAAAAAKANAKTKIPPVAAPAPTPPADSARIEGVAKAVGGLAAGLDRLVTEVSGLRTLSDRLDALERRTPATAPSPSSKEAERVAGDLARLSSQVDELKATVKRAETPYRDANVTKLVARVDELGQAQARLETARRSQPAPPPDLSAVVHRLEQRLEQVCGQITPLASLAEQVMALESVASSADAQTAVRVNQLTARVEGLASAIEPLRSAPAQAPAAQERNQALEKVVGELVRSTERLSARVSGLDEVPKRLEALEAVEQPPVGKVLTSMGKRLDRLSTQVGELKTLPERVIALEGEQGRSESLTRGLGGAIDMIDELSAQMAAIQGSDRAGNGSTH